MLIAAGTVVLAADTAPVPQEGVVSLDGTWRIQPAGGEEREIAGAGLLGASPRPGQRS